MVSPWLPLGLASVQGIRPLADFITSQQRDQTDNAKRCAFVVVYLLACSRLVVDRCLLRRGALIAEVRVGLPPPPNSLGVGRAIPSRKFCGKFLD